MNILKHVFLIFVFLVPKTAFAGDLVYAPLLPAFGGNPGYTSYFTGNAQAQNRFREIQEKLSDSARFKRDLERRLLSAVANNIVEAIYGEGSAEDGSFTVGDTNIEFRTVDGEVVVTVTSPDGTTTIKLPAKL